jgi:hypothetical protein
MDEHGAAARVDEARAERPRRPGRRVIVGAALVGAAIVAGLVVGVVVPRSGGDVGTGPSAQPSSSPTASPQLAAASGRAKHWLAGRGFSVVSVEVLPGSDVTGREEVALGVVHSSAPSAQPATVRVVLYPHLRPAGVYAERCTEALCTRGPRIVDCGFSPGIVCGAAWVTSGDVPGIGAGARIIDEHLGDRGGLLEVAAGADPATAGSDPTPILTDLDLRELTRSVATPDLRGRVAPLPAAPPCRAGDVSVTAGAPTAEDGWTGPALDVRAAAPGVRCTLTGFPTVSGLVDTAGRALRFDALERAEQVPTASVLVSSDANADGSARVRLYAADCLTAGGTAAASLQMTLPGDGTPIPVALSPGLGPLSCTRAGSKGTALALSPFYAQEL